MQVSDLQIEHFWDCRKNLLCLKECFSFHLLTVCPQFMGRDNALWKFHAVLMAVLLRNALQISQQGTGGIFRTSRVSRSTK